MKYIPWWLCLVCTILGCSDTRGVVLERFARDAGGEESDGAFDTQSSDTMGLDVDVGDTASETDSFEGDTSVVRSEYCEGEGPPVRGDACAFPSESVDRALCVCGDYENNGLLRTRLIDEDAPDRPDEGASIGVMGLFSPGTPATIGGDLRLSQSATLATDMVVAGELTVGGELRNSLSIAVERDARVNGDLVVDGDLRVDGALVQPAGSQVTVGGTTQVAEQQTAPVSAEPVCACARSTLAIAGHIDAARLENDNATIGLEPDALDQPDQDTVLTLPCGRFFLDRIGSSERQIELRIEGRVALYVAEDVVLERDLGMVFVGEGAELDLFVGGTLNSSATVQLGDRARPEDMRMYIGGSVPLDISGVFNFSGLLYAPESSLVLTGNSEVFGSVLVGRVAASGSVVVFYAPKLREVARRCDP